MKTLAVISVLVTVVFAQNSTLIPSGISPGCQAALNTLNTDTTLSGCLSALTSATSSLLSASAGTPSSSVVASDVTNVCGSSTTSQCTDTLIRPKLSALYAGCQAELATSPVPSVVDLYDTFYSIVPFLQSICSKDDNGDSCVGQVKANVAISSLYTTVGSGAQAVLTPNAQTIANDNILFFGLNPQMSSIQLCTPCTRNILTNYINFQTEALYAPGMSNTEFFTGQSALYQAVQNTCGSSFVSGTVAAAGSLSNGVLSTSGASRTAASSVGASSLVLGVVAIAFAAAL